MSNEKPVSRTDAVRNTHVAYDDYKLQVSQKMIQVLAVVTAAVNLILIVPDWMFIGGISDRILVASLRAAYSALLLAFSFRVKRLRSFRPFSLLVLAYETAALALFLFVMTRYERFDFLIQAMGYSIFTLVVFLVPNRTQNTIVLTSAGAAAFFLAAKFLVTCDNPNAFWAAIVYVALAIILCSIFASSTERHQFREYIAKSKLEHMSSTDFLTETANRFRLEEEAGRWMDFCRRQGMPLSLAFVDVDNLKNVNDRYGHAVGDTILVGLAKLFQRQLRSSDTLARWGGDEFVLLLPNTPIKSANILMERMRAAVDEQAFASNIRITWSCGIAQMKPEDSFHTMLCRADALMYDGKHGGKNSICCEDAAEQTDNPD